MKDRRRQWLPFHIYGNWQVKDLQNHRCDVDYTKPVDSASTWHATVSWPEKKDAVLRVVGSVRPSIVFEGVYFSIAHSANGAPEKSAKINDQIRRHTAHLFI